MKFRELGKWVGIYGVNLRRRAKNLGHAFELNDQIDATMANKLYRDLPLKKTLTITYKDVRHPQVEFIGSWNMRDWQRLLNKIQREILVRNRDFIRAVRKNGQAKPSVEPVEEVVEAIVQPEEVITEDQPVSVPEAVSNISALVQADAVSVESIFEEHTHAIRNEVASTRTSSGTCESDRGPGPNDPGSGSGDGDGDESVAGPAELGVSATDGVSDSNAGDVEEPVRAYGTAGV